MTNKLIVPEVELILNQMKEEIAAELGIIIHPDMTAREAGKIGGTLTKRLIDLGKQSLLESTNVITHHYVDLTQNQIH
jgi:hypothetical protein